MFGVVMPYTGGAIATREPVIAQLTLHRSIGFDLEILMSPDRRGGGGATQNITEAKCLTWQWATWAAPEGPCAPSAPSSARIDNGLCSPGTAGLR